MAHAEIQWFIYYRVAQADLAPALAVVREFQRKMASGSPALRCAVLRRPGETDGRVTLMETYAPASESADGIRPAEAVAEDPGRAAGPWDGLPGRLLKGPPRLAAWLQGERHLETFVPCA